MMHEPVFPESYIERMHRRRSRMSQKSIGFNTEQRNNFKVRSKSMVNNFAHQQPVYNVLERIRLDKEEKRRIRMERLEERERKLAQMKMFALDDQPQKVKSTPKVEIESQLCLNLEEVTLDKNHSAVVQEIDSKQILKKRRRTIQT